MRTIRVLALRYWGKDEVMLLVAAVSILALVLFG